ncbi:MAG: methyltransferase domain-containing protein [Flavobacteriales bacterium]|nr:hypothetical protein [Flavobacteriales bacterium]MCC6578721.1 methyltransferase domain-containing protein [Flavobacteriales bacterium]NUQ16145.1 methyltransferase domain-containing protein [Flavobacteriales bacterium]
MADLIWRLLSMLWPVRVARWEGRYQPLELTYELGRPVVNSRRANQSWGSLHRLWQQVFREVLPPAPGPDTALVLGFGAGSVASILHHEHRRPTRITGVEGEPRMLQLAHRQHRPYRRDLVTVHVDDAFAWATAWSGPPFALVVVDLFVELDMPAPMDGPTFLDDLRRLTAPDGVLVVNTIRHDEMSADRSERIGAGLRLRFGTVEERMLEDVNRVFIAR